MIKVYTDGSAIYKKMWFGGAGYVVTRSKTHDQINPQILATGSIPLMGGTSQIGEIYAACHALHQLASVSRLTRIDKDIYIVSDSEYVVLGWNQYLPHWIRSNWCKTNGKPISNKRYWENLMDQIRYLERRGHRIRFQKTTAHQKGRGETLSLQIDSQLNEVADRLAGTAARSLL